MELKLTIIQGGATPNQTHDFESYNALLEFITPKLEGVVKEEVKAKVKPKAKTTKKK